MYSLSTASLFWFSFDVCDNISFSDQMSSLTESNSTSSDKTWRLLSDGVTTVRFMNAQNAAISIKSVQSESNFITNRRYQRNASRPVNKHLFMMPTKEEKSTSNLQVSWSNIVYKSVQRTLEFRMPRTSHRVMSDFPLPEFGQFIRLHTIRSQKR